jgi:hypothetical protein
MREKRVEEMTYVQKNVEENSNTQLVPYNDIAHSGGLYEQ